MKQSGWHLKSSPYHAGEQAIHERLGRKEHQERMARMIHSPFMPDQHREFYNQLPFLLVGSVDQQGWPWASIMFGKPGFVSSPDDTQLQINNVPIVGDPLKDNLRQSKTPLGFLGIELPTRRRNRMNGLLNHRDDESITVDVVQAYGNCPQYIQTRDMTFIRDPQATFTPEVERFTSLSAEAADVIRNADTFFVASYNDRDDKHTDGGTDVSHRGGKPGFVKVDGNTLTIPDYIGNFAFNTLGNFEVNPKAGLLFVDFNSGDLWQLTGTVEIVWDKTAEIAAFRGAERAWHFNLEHGVCLKQAAPMRWQLNELSPNSHLTGDWQDVALTLSAQAKNDAWQPYRISRIEDESSSIRSFYLQPATDNGALARYEPGQFLTVRVKPDIDGAKTSQQIRTYTLSSAPADNMYRISVKRETHGAVSQHLHDTFSVGDVIEARSPRGDFTLDTREERPVALFAAGVGITPMISMARQAISDRLRIRHLRPITIFHSARTTAERAFTQEFSDLQKTSEGLLRYISIVSQPETEEQQGQHFHFNGRLNQTIIQSALSLDDYDCYICGPTGFMQAVYDTLIALGVRDERIHAESFGPASLKRTASANTAEDFAQVEEALVSFEQSGFEQVWTPEAGTLLELAESHGLTPEFGCRSGACGSCAVRLLAGKTGYINQPATAPEDGKVLICCAVPAQSDERLKLDL